MTDLTRPRTTGTVSRERYAAACDRLGAALTAAPPDAPVRLAKRTSNLFRTRERGPRVLLDVADLAGVLAVDPERRTADVLGMTTYEDLVDVTLAYGLMPLVVPELKSITLGGAVTGLGIESTAFRNGLPHESVLEMDVLTGDGRIRCARPDNEHADLFYGFPNSYGSLGYALRLTIELEPVRPYVALRHLAFDDPDACFAAVARITDERSWDGRRVDFLDGTAFCPDELYLTLGTFADTAPATSDYTGMDVYYRSIRQRTEDHLTVRDYLWRWDTDWFWCSAAFGAQRPLLRRLWPKRWLRSDVYWRLVALENRYGIQRRLDRLRGRPPREAVIQDVEVPVDRAADFLRTFDREVGMRPVWLCPLRQGDPTVTWDLYPLDAATTYVNVGFWGTVPLAPGQDPHAHTTRVERLVTDLGGRASLYSTAYYEPDEFWRLYGGDTYHALRGRYDPHGRLLDLYAKCVQAR